MASSLSPGDACTDSQSLAELSTMFPTIDYSVLVSVLQAHNGRLDTTVEYFMMENSDTTGHRDNPTHSTVDPSQDMVGQFSEDIGGLPEMLPSFIYDVQENLNSDENDSSSSHAPSRSPTPDSNVDSEDDPLPTYDEACTDADRLPEAVYILDDGQSLDHPEGMHVEETVSQVNEQRAATNGGSDQRVRSKKHKKVRKLASKLKSVRGKGLNVKIAKGKRSSESSVSARSGYAPLCSDQEMEIEDPSESYDST